MVWPTLDTVRFVERPTWVGQEWLSIKLESKSVVVSRNHVSLVYLVRNALLSRSDLAILFLS